jgi:hypothetical protein
MKKMAATALLSLALATGQTQTPPRRVFTGVISDSMCLNDHKHMGETDEAKCIRECVKSGRYKLVLWDGKNAYKLSDQETPAQFAAERVNVTGMLYEKTGVIKVEKIERAAAKKK